MALCATLHPGTQRMGENVRNIWPAGGLLPSMCDVKLSQGPCKIKK